MAAGMILLVPRRVTRPLVTIQQAMLKLAGGDFNVVLPGLDRKDEVGAIANAVEKFKVLAVEKGRQDAEEVLRRQQAEAELQAKAAEERAKSPTSRRAPSMRSAMAWPALGRRSDLSSERAIPRRLQAGEGQFQYGARSAL